MLNEMAATASAKIFEIIDRLEKAGGGNETKITIERVPAPVLEDEYE